jgi:hypothetical protein
LQVDIEQTGFSTGEIDILIDGVETKGLPEDDVLPPVERDQLVSREGDIWELGSKPNNSVANRIGC